MLFSRLLVPPATQQGPAFSIPSVELYAGCWRSQVVLRREMACVNLFSAYRVLVEAEAIVPTDTERILDPNC